MSLLLRRVARVARTRSLGVASRAVVRELAYRRAEFQLGRAARRGDPILAGPFVGEVGYELLYWIPYLRRLLREHGIKPERVTVLTRGGAGAWYADLASREIEILDLIPFERFHDQLLARRARVRDAKQTTLDPFDGELAARARERLDGEPFLVHPRIMYAHLRFVWEGLLHHEHAATLGDYRRIVPPSGRLPPEAALPERFVAVKAYFNEVLPASDVTRAFLASLVERLAGDIPVVVLANADAPDEHEEWRMAGVGVVDATQWLEPRDNLAVQTEIVAAADALVCTYGGFSYLGPLLDIPTVALHSGDADNPRHLEVARTALPGPRIEFVRVDGGAAAEHVAARLVKGAAA
jgi:hypothetical protein